MLVSSTLRQELSSAKPPYELGSTAAANKVRCHLFPEEHREHLFTGQWTNISKLEYDFSSEVESSVRYRYILECAHAAATAISTLNRIDCGCI